ncbi:MAG: TadE family protein [Bryobacterales bacterium]|jgi:Flp pilus assembly protein TadG|nr:TadE family protein [Bryobacterales bacterium]
MKMSRDRRGHALLELAVSAAVMVSCLAGTVEFGYTFYIYNELVTAVGNGGRYAAMRTYRSAAPADIEKGKAAIRNMVVYGDARPAPGTLPQVANLSPEQVQVEWVTDDSGGPAAVNVAIGDYTVDAVFGIFRFTGRPAVEFPFVGRFAPAESEP